MSAVATIGNGLSNGCRELSTTAGRVPALRPKPHFPEPGGPEKGDRGRQGAQRCSNRPNWVRKFGWLAWAPMVERQTTFRGLAASRASSRRQRCPWPQESLASGRRSAEIITNTPSTPLRAAVSAAASSISARAISQPRCFQAAPLAVSRMTARTDRPVSSRVRAAAPGRPGQ